ncbi:MAG TPA: SURF1 family protein [Pseudolabrys sp.]|nr:SURF1 family protein [Pseudolabrys sp.]
MSKAPRKRKGTVLDATILALAGVGILVGLGTWQLDRKAWKENLIANLSGRLGRAPQELPPRASWTRLREDGEEFRRVFFPAEFLDGEEALVYTAGSPLRPDVKGPGYWVFAPARLPGGSIVLINRGFVPDERKDPAMRAEGAPHGIVDVVGVMRWPEMRTPFTPADDPKKNVWYLRDVRSIADAKKWLTAAPFYIDQEEPAPPGGWPKPGKLEVHLPDNHLEYAITWFGLALALAGVYVVWLSKRIVRRRP